MVSAGKLKYLITIKTPQPSRDAMGGEIISWVVKYLNLPAFVEDYGGKEKFHAESLREVSYDRKRIEIRYMTNIKVTDKVSYLGLDYDIIRVEQLGFRESTRMTVELAE